MKVLGMSLDGGTIVELSKAEAETLRLAQNAMRGEINCPGPYKDKLVDESMERTFYLIREFARARFFISEFEYRTQMLKDALLKHEGGSHE